MNNQLSIEAKKDLELIKLELKKDQPDTDILFNLISGTKYNIHINPNK